jgi:hypothetical protein
MLDRAKHFTQAKARRLRPLARGGPLPVGFDWLNQRDLLEADAERFDKLSVSPLENLRVSPLENLTSTSSVTTGDHPWRTSGYHVVEGLASTGSANESQW